MTCGDGVTEFTSELMADEEQQRVVYLEQSSGQFLKKEVSKGITNKRRIMMQYTSRKVTG